MVRDLELVALKPRRVSALREDFAGLVVAFHDIAGVFVVAPVLAGLEAVGGCGGCAKGGDEGVDGEKMHFYSFFYSFPFFSLRLGGKLGF